MRLVLGFLLAISSANILNAGSMLEPEIEASIVIEDTAASTGGWIVPVLFLLILIAAVAPASGAGAAPVVIPVI